MERKKVLCRVASWPNLITAASSCSPSRTAACRVAPDGHQPLAHARDLSTLTYGFRVDHEK